MVWTTKTKGKLDWKAPPPSVATGEKYELLIGGGFKLNVGSGFNLTIQPEDAPTNWETITKQKLSFPQEVASTTQKLDIGGGFQLDVGDGFELIAGTSERNDTDWTTTTKTGR